MHKKTKGSIGELCVAASILQAGWSVLFPFGENQPYDLVAEKDGKFLRIQVKYTTPQNGVLTVNCRSSNNWSITPYTVNDFEIIAAYNPSERISYFIPVSMVNRSALILRLEKTKNNQQLGVHVAEDFLSFEKALLQPTLGTL